jgi:hypothetical protein
VVLHRTPPADRFTRSGSRPRARHAGIPVARRLESSTCSSLSPARRLSCTGAHLGRRRSTPGRATSSTRWVRSFSVAPRSGTRHQIAGTLGPLCIAVLVNGLRMAALPAPWADPRGLRAHHHPGSAHRTRRKLVLGVAGEALVLLGFDAAGGARWRETARRVRPSP